MGMVSWDQTNYDAGQLSLLEKQLVKSKDSGDGLPDLNPISTTSHLGYLVL